MFSRDDKVSPIRLTAAQYIILAIFLMLAYGLWKLQVMESGYYASAAEKNRIRNVPILAPRGKILDREGRIIVDNYPSFSALLLRGEEIREPGVNFHANHELNSSRWRWCWRWRFLALIRIFFAFTVRSSRRILRSVACTVY